ncbi:hypothetical protein [Thiolapillus sp.]|uniref:hypothetical protein n=1 Tax=Thiolapillus sp. TaxID=2017437 RepID=UPI0025DE084F|nr:hypothetical protein [Thiolapillus sp.]
MSSYESRIKKKLLIVAASASVVVATAAGVYYWDAMLVGIVAVLLWLKKMATLKGLLILLKKLPFLLLLGMKRLVIKVTSRFLLFSAHLRFYRVQRLLRYLRVRAYLVKRRLKYHWGDLSGVEQMLATVAALPLVIVLSVLLVIFVLPKAVFSFLGNKIKEHSSAAVLKQAAQFGVKEKLQLADRKIKEKIREKLLRKRRGKAAGGKTEDVTAGADDREHTGE